MAIWSQGSSGVPTAVGQHQLPDGGLPFTNTSRPGSYNCPRQLRGHHHQPRRKLQSRNATVTKLKRSNMRPPTSMRMKMEKNWTTRTLNLRMTQPTSRSATRHQRLHWRRLQSSWHPLNPRSQRPSWIHRCTMLWQQLTESQALAEACLWLMHHLCKSELQ